MVIRPAKVEDAAGIARVDVLSWRSTYRGILPDNYLGGMSLSGREREWRNHLMKPVAAGGQILLVAEGAGEIVGFAEGGLEREGVPGFEGELNALYFLREWQQRGLGRRLVQEFARTLATRGLNSMIVWVLAANPSRGFYPAIGGEEIAKELELVGTSVHEKVAYGWRDLSVFLR